MSYGDREGVSDLQSIAVFKKVVAIEINKKMDVDEEVRGKD